MHSFSITAFISSHFARCYSHGSTVRSVTCLLMACTNDEIKLFYRFKCLSQEQLNGQAFFREVPITFSFVRFVASPTPHSSRAVLQIIFNCSLSLEPISKEINTYQPPRIYLKWISKAFCTSSTSSHFK